MVTFGWFTLRWLVLVAFAFIGWFGWFVVTYVGSLPFGSLRLVGSLVTLVYLRSSSVAFAFYVGLFIVGSLVWLV